MKIVRIFLLIATLFLISASSPAPVQAGEAGVDAGFSVASTGTNGWYVSDWTVHAVSPVLANGRLLMPGESLTITDEGEQSIEFVSPDGTSRATQMARIDKTPPSVSWNSRLNTEVTDLSSDLSAEIADHTSGVCLIEISTDNGRSWIEEWSASKLALDEPIYETTWTYHAGFSEFDHGEHSIIMRARDCAGNFNAGKTLVVNKR